MYQPKSLMDKAQVNLTDTSGAIAAARNKLPPDVRSTGVTAGRPVDMHMFPWLLPVSVAVVMVIFLICSFFHHHRRFLQQRRHASRHYLHEYRRVAGPIFSLAATLSATPGGGGGEQDDQPTSILTASALTKRLRRCYSWSPRIFKTKHHAGLRNNPSGLSASKKTSQLLDSRNSLGSIVQGLAPSSHKSPEDPAFPARVLEEIQALQKTTGLSEEKLNAELYAIAHWASLSQSSRRKSRSLVVTTSSGALATDHRQSEPDVTSLDHNTSQEVKIDIEMPPRSPDGKSVNSKPDLNISDVHATQTSGPEFLNENYTNPQFSPQDARDSVLYPPTPEADGSTKPDSTNADMVPTIQITPTTDEAYTNSNTSFYRAAPWHTDVTEENNNDAISCKIKGHTRDLEPSAHIIIPGVPAHDPHQIYITNTQDQIPGNAIHNQVYKPKRHDKVSRHDPIPSNIVLKQSSKLTRHESLKRHNFTSNTRKATNCYQPATNLSEGNFVFPEPDSSKSPTVACPVTVLKSLCEVYRVVRALRNIFAPELREPGPAALGIDTETESKSKEKIYLNTADHKLPGPRSVDKGLRKWNGYENKQVNSTFDVSEHKNRYGTGNPQNFKDTTPATDLNTFKTLCSNCAAIKEILVSLEQSNLYNIEQFLAQTLTQLQPHSDDGSLTSTFTTPSTTTETSTPATKRERAAKASSHTRYTEESIAIEIPFLAGRRRAASESSTLPECQPLLCDRDSIIINDSCEIYSNGIKQCCSEKKNIPQRGRNIQESPDSDDSVFLDSCPPTRHELDRKEPAKTEKDLIGYRKDPMKEVKEWIGYQSLPDSPKSYDSVDGYMDNSLTSLHESVV
ncbi:hypothetical protein ElyMa_001434800 [Elysia marginata]|uniref:Uncharacterized protein n=1 Tax=Elysia marginata TaxID=1093978 RepID=A0AAV4IZK5_9GAST|nr:hypothetical protein ElyMa_001434800 [Elysia marginata]